MRGRKNDFSMTFYYHNERVMFLKYVHDTDKAIAWMKSKNKFWTHARVYWRRTEEFITTLKNQ